MINLVLRHAQAIWFAVILLTIGGIVAALNMPVSLFPHVNFPRVVVAVDAGDRDAAQMAAQVTRPMEIALRSVLGVTRIRSTTSRGSAEISLDFSWGEDMVAAALGVEGALAGLLPDMPAGTRFDVHRADPTVFPVLGMALTSDTLDQQALRQLAILKLRPALVAVTGVAGVDVLGGSPTEFEVSIDPAKLHGYGLGIDDVAATLKNANDVQGIGKIEDRHRLYLVLVQSRIKDIGALSSLPVRLATGATTGIVTLGKVADIRPVPRPVFTRVTSNGRDAVLVNIRQSLTGDTVAIVRAVNTKLKTIGLPPSVKLTPFYDQSELVVGAANAVRDAILFGALLAGMVLYLFLRSGRLMLITGLMLPGVLAATCLILYALGMGFNMMTLGGMAAAVGLVVDDAVVMLEHMMRKVQEGATTEARSLLGGAAEMGRALAGSTLATMIIFLPLSFVTGVTGGFFKALAITMVAALGVSFLYARFVVPLLAAHWVTSKDAAAVERAGGIMGLLERGYLRASDFSLARPRWFVFGVIVIIAAIGYVSWRQVPSGFMPKMDEGGFVLDYKAKSGAALTDTDHLLREVGQIITSTPEVASYSRRTGLQLGGGLTEADEGDYFVRLKSGNRRPIEDVMADIRHKVETRVPGLEVELIQLMEDLIGDLTAVPQPIEVKLFSDQSAVLADSARKVGEALGKIDGVVEIFDGLRVAGDAVSIHVDPGLAAQHDLDPRQVANQLATLVGGSGISSTRIGEQLVTIRLRGATDQRARIEQLKDLELTAPDGRLVRVGAIASVRIDAGQRQLTRENLAPMIAVTARLEGRDLGSGMKDVKSAVSALNLPASVRVEYGGLYAQQQKSFLDLSLVFASALLLTMLLLTLLFEHFSWVICAATTVLLSACMVLFGLWVCGIELNISALMGLTMVVGMVTELVIFYLAEIDHSAKLDISVLHEAGRKRLRPILMSALIAVLTLSPLALGISRGAGLQQPLATAIIFGLVAAVPLVLLFLPAALMLVTRFRKVGTS